MKILFISHTFPPIVGGVETQNYELSRWLSEQEDVALLANKKRWMIPFFLLFSPLYALVKAPSYDVLLLGSGILGNVGWFIKKLTKKPVAIVTHGLDLTWKNGLYQNLWVKNFIPSADLLVAVGNETIRSGVSRGIPAEKFMFIPNGVDTEKNLVHASRADLEKILDQSLFGKQILLTSGRLARRKGVAWFVRNVMPKLGENILYVIAGAGPDKENIEVAIKENNLEKRVLMLGYVTDEVRNTLFATCDLFIQPNITVPGDMEGFGISVIEAASCKIPVLAANIEGLKDAIKDGENGFLIQSENADAYVQKITNLLSDETYRKSFGEKARNYVIEHYQWNKIAQLYADALNSLRK